MINLVRAAKIWDAGKAVVADPEPDGCDLRDSGNRMRIAERVYPFGNDPTASMQRRIAYCEVGMDFCELPRAALAPNRFAIHGDK